MKRVRRRRTDGVASGEQGSAIVEFIFLAVLVLIPMIYLVVAVAVVQRSRVTVANAARDVGRAIATAETAPDAERRADAALRIAIAGQGFSATDVELRFVAAVAPCDGAIVDPELSPGAEFAVCVLRHEQLPAVPGFLSGRGITTVGRYVVHIDDFRHLPH